MKIADKSLRTGFAIPELGQGTWGRGGRESADATHDEADIDAIRRGIESGLHHIDTAELYGDGHAEELVGEAIRSYDRQALFLTGKVWKTHLHYDDVLRACEASLRRLGTDYLDLYLIHQVNPEVAVAETMRAMNRLVHEGVIRAIGVSNFSEQRLRAAMAAAEAPVAANQLHYNLKVRESESGGLLDFCRENGVVVIAWRPLREVETDLPLVRELADRYGKTPKQVALNFLLSQPGVATVVKASRQEHIDEDIGASGWSLDPADLERLRRDYPGQQTKSPVVPLI